MVFSVVVTVLGRNKCTVPLVCCNSFPLIHPSESALYSADCEVIDTVNVFHEVDTEVAVTLDEVTYVSVPVVEAEVDTADENYTSQGAWRMHRLCLNVALLRVRANLWCDRIALGNLLGVGT